ncbi:hypothetical protein F5148DRAFT_447131 [Russula earlei]|uniref:Uncharacterized protein n=1 Tax=Russula earlei TaxID=71964 RepID=A0ACC0U095_9AGAM|nr:hypothetical protein F5148DRAFT_447131 [Russula earlei]
MQMIIVICVKALPVSSFPIVGLNRNWSSNAVASPSRMTDQKHFDIAITFGEPVDSPASPTQTASAVANFFQSLAPRPVRHLAVAGVPDDRRKARRQESNWLVLAPRTIAQRFDAFLRAVTAALRVGINNRGRPATRPAGGPSAPVATALQARLQRVRSMRAAATVGGGRCPSHVRAELAYRDPIARVVYPSMMSLVMDCDVYHLSHRNCS